MTRWLDLPELSEQYIFETAPLVFLLLSSNGKIVRANRFAEAFCGSNPEGCVLEDLIIDFTGELDLQKLYADPGKEYLLSVNRKGSDPESLHFTFARVKDGIAVFGRLDVNEIDLMRREVLSLNSELSNLTRQLHQKNAQLGLLNAQKNQFLGMAAHDLRKPIGLITTYSEFLLEEASDVLDDEHLDFLHTVHSSAFSMKRLVDDFLDVSAIEAGRFNIDLQFSDIGEVLANCLRLINILAAKKGVQIQVLGDHAGRSIMMDAPKIEQVMANLVSNAVEHTEPGSSVSIFISSSEEELVVEVKDSGPGIPEGEMEHLFKAFERTSVKKSGKVKSTGLGLAISRKIIEAHGGRISAESTPGEGTTFSFSLPYN